MNKKVYCVDCKYYRKWLLGDDCINENETTIHTYYDKYVIRIWNPSIRNANNDCKDYESK